MGIAAWAGPGTYGSPTNASSRQPVPQSTGKKKSSSRLPEDDYQATYNNDGSLTAYGKKSGVKTGLPAQKAPLAAASPAGGGLPATGGSLGSGGGPVVAPSSTASMEALVGSGAGGNGDEAATGILNSPSRFRQGIGTRMLPMESASLASLRKVY